MRSFRLWLEGHVWLVATAGVAAIVFGVTFIAVSAATNDDPVIPDQVIAAPGRDAEPASEPEADVSVPAPADTDPGTEDLALAQPIEPEPAATEQVATPDPEAESAADGDGAVPAQEVAQEPPPRPLPEFDEDELVLGGSGEAGAILGGQGIVRSSGVDRRTPWEFLLPSAKIRADIVRVGLTASNAFGAPDNPEVIGWWETGPAPGEPGNVLLDGHRDFTDTEGNIGTGVCWLLPETGIGDFIVIRDNEARTNHLYTVIETTSVPRDDQDGVAYLQPTRESILTLVTCEGSFDTGNNNYSNRRIVVAELTDTIPFPAVQ